MAEIIEGGFHEETNSESIVAYQYNDLQHAAKSILAKATETANNKIEQAKKNIYELEEKMRKQGYDKGFEEGIVSGEVEGRKNGEAAARTEFEAKIGGLNGALHNTLGELNFRKQTIQAQAEADLLALALEIAKKIVRREIEVDQKFVVPILQEAVALTNNKNDLMIKVNPEDHAAIEAEIPTLKAIFNDIGRVNIMGDEAIEKGGVIVASREGDVDMGIEEQFAALEKALIGDIEGMEEWNGQVKTQMPVPQEVVTPVAPPPTPVPVPQTPAPATAGVEGATINATPPAPVSPPSSAPEPPEPTPSKPPVEPSRRRGPRARKNPQPETVSDGNPVSQENVPSVDNKQVEPAVTSTSTASQSSLSGVSDLNALTLGSNEEAIIKEVLGAQNGEQ